MVAGLLFLAFAFFAVGQASATRNGAQGAADSAALAAAQRAREEVAPKVLAALMTSGGLETIFDDGVVLADAHAEAANFAAKNHADLQTLDPRPDGVGRFTFKAIVKTQYTVGKSVIPGTEQDHGTAAATAVVELRCSLPPGGVAGSSQAPTPTPTPTPTSTPPSPGTITCGGKDLPTDPMPAPEELFTVKLVD
ncbi:pilus assembly protein TadG-related protein [Streptomyces sp. NBC_00442]|uniref:pilus assembly protein TadG-related protein n=1 Tax=Streptomyces sp. NBC_00442 TaxID=2903651 RepID=UPI003FA6B5DE